MKKILIVCNNVPYPPSDGASIRIFNLIKNMATSFNINLCCFYNDKLVEADIAQLKKYCSKVEMVKKEPRSPIITNLKKVATIFSRTPYITQLSKSEEMHKKIDGILSSQHYDAIIIEELILSQFYVNKTGVLGIITAHNYETLIIKRYYENSKKIAERFYYYIQYNKMKKYEMKEIEKYDLCLTVSEKDKQSILDNNPKLMVATVENGVDIDYFSFIDHSKHPDKIIFTGALGYKPNRDGVLYFLENIYPKLKIKIPDLRFYIVGKNPPKQLERISELDPSVITTGFVKDVRSYVNECSIFIVPLKVGGGTRLKILEAFSMGIPVISTSIGAEGLCVEDKKHLIIADSDESFINSITNLNKDINLQKYLANNARELVEKRYSWQSIAYKFSNLLQNLFSENFNNGSE